MREIDDPCDGYDGDWDAPCEKLGDLREWFCDLSAGEVANGAALDSDNHCSPRFSSGSLVLLCPQTRHN
jgi:hypothetical protein